MDIKTLELKISLERCGYTFFLESLDGSVNNTGFLTPPPYTLRYTPPPLVGITKDEFEKNIVGTAYGHWWQSLKIQSCDTYKNMWSAAIEELEELKKENQELKKFVSDVDALTPSLPDNAATWLVNEGKAMLLDHFREKAKELLDNE